MNLPLKIALLERGFRQFDLSKLLGIDPAKLSKIVNGWIQPDDQTKQEISRYLGKPIDHLFPNDVETGATHADS
jgi:transcriptional regulator with XRE-family HTH domain